MQNGVLFVLFTQSWFKCRSHRKRSLSLCAVFDLYVLIYNTDCCWFCLRIVQRCTTV